MTFSQPSASRISIHTLRVEGDPDTPPPYIVWMISIHTLRVEGDLRWALNNRIFSISIHTLRVEGDKAALHAKCHR